MIIGDIVVYQEIPKKITKNLLELIWNGQIMSSSSILPMAPLVLLLSKMSKAFCPGLQTNL